MKKIIVGGRDGFIACLKTDCTVVAVGNNDYGQCNTQDWTDIREIHAGSRHLVGLRYDGTVVAVGNNEYGQCDVGSWTNIKTIKVGEYSTVGLRYDGTVVAVGYYGMDSYDIEEGEEGKVDTSKFENVEEIFVCEDKIIVRLDNGKFDYCGGTCSFKLKDIEGCSSLWTNTATSFVVGTHLTRIVCSGYENDNQKEDLAYWGNDISDIATGLSHTVARTHFDRRIVAAGSNEEGQCNVEDWSDIYEVFAGDFCTAATTFAGTVLSTIHSKEVSSWKDIYTIVFAGGWREQCIVGVKEDGTLVCTSGIKSINNNMLSSIKLCNESLEWEYKEAEKAHEEMTKQLEQVGKELKEQRKKAKEERKRIEYEQYLAKVEEEKQQKKRQEYRSMGVCQHCGGKFKGIFKKTCTNCGKIKDY